MRDEAVLDIVVDPEVALDQVTEALDDLVGVLIQQSLQAPQGLELVEVLLELRIQVRKHVQVLL